MNPEPGLVSARCLDEHVHLLTDVQRLGVRLYRVDHLQDARVGALRVGAGERLPGTTSGSTRTNVNA